MEIVEKYLNIEISLKVLNVIENSESFDNNKFWKALTVWKVLEV